MDDRRLLYRRIEEYKYLGITVEGKHGGFKSM